MSTETSPQMRLDLAPAPPEIVAPPARKLARRADPETSHEARPMTARERQKPLEFPAGPRAVETGAEG